MSFAHFKSFRKYIDLGYDLNIFTESNFLKEKLTSISRSIKKEICLVSSNLNFTVWLFINLTDVDIFVFPASFFKVGMTTEDKDFLLQGTHENVN